MSAEPAFLRPSTPNGARQDGMTLRDYFAGQALPETMAAMQSGLIGPHYDAGGGASGFAATAYDIADAMLAQRTKG